MRAGINVEEQRVLFNGKQLEDGQQLAEVGVCEEQTLYILMRLLGGAKKRKKKTYTKPKKQKHKHLKIKLRVLKFYKVRGGRRHGSALGRPVAPGPLRNARTRCTMHVPSSCPDWCPPRPAAAPAEQHALGRVCVEQGRGGGGRKGQAPPGVGCALPPLCKAVYACARVV